MSYDLRTKAASEPVVVHASSVDIQDAGHRDVTGPLAAIRRVDLILPGTRRSEWV